MLKYLNKQLKRLEATKREVTKRDPHFNTSNLTKEIKQLRSDIEAAKECLKSYYSKESNSPAVSSNKM